MGRLIDVDRAINVAKETCTLHDALIIKSFLEWGLTVEAIPKDNVYKAIQEMMKYEHEGFINISLTRLDEILKKCGVCEDEKED